MGELFDRYVAVDWSAAARPVTGPNSIWIAVLDSGGGCEPVLANPGTRRLAERAIGELHDRGMRTLVAVDASLGYPVGSAAWFDLDGAEPWRAMWDHVAGHLTDGDDNSNDRFALAAALNRRHGADGPFWGCPRGTTFVGLSAFKPAAFKPAAFKPAAFALPEFRRVEQRMRAVGRRPASGWQLLGAGSVGSQTLTLLPVLHRLVATRAGAGSTVEVWPFTTGLAAPSVGPGTTVVVETWPTAFDLDLWRHPVRDAAQVDGVVRRLRDADAVGELARWFTPDVAPEERGLVEREEGWALVPPG